MAKLVKLEIKNFRGISSLSIDFDHTKNLICFIGRGDSGKTTILEAISMVLSSTWNLTLDDSDFYACNSENSIEIKATLIDLPEKLMSEDRFGLYGRVFNLKTSEISDDITIPQHSDFSDLADALTIKLHVDDCLEPKWTITNAREQEDKSITAADRLLLNCYMISDYLDRHFSWNKGNPLYSLLKSAEDISRGKDVDDVNVIVQTLRVAKKKIDEHPFGELDEVTALLKSNTASLGLNILNTKTTLDFKDLFVKDGKISLHDESIPFRLKGKGSKRLISLAIQLALVNNGGIMLVDEIEQGLEPDRVKQAIRTLKESSQGQFFVTTHSRDVITELGSEPLYLVLKDKKAAKIEIRSLSYKDKIQSLVRSCPEAFFAKKIIVCEGATEIGICRALDSYRKLQGKELISFKDCAYVDGTGDSMIDRAKNIKAVQLNTAILCDSDKDKKPWKGELRDLGIEIFDWEENCCIEHQAFRDLPWQGIKELLHYVLISHKNNDLEALKASVKSKCPDTFVFSSDWLEADSPELRTAFAETSVVHKKEWFKRIDHGEFLGEVIFKYFDSLEDGERLKHTLTSLCDWIDQ